MEKDPDPICRSKIPACF